MTVPADLRVLFLASLAAAVLSGAAAAVESHSSVRLLDAGEDGGKFRAGVEITLEPGWKTYWRMPGEAGVPPDFDWSGSANVETVEVSYPAPHRFLDSGGEAIGYKERVVFPVAVTRKVAGEPVDLSLTLHYAVCNDICIPAKAELRRRLGETSPPAEEVQAVREAETLVPASVAPGLEVKSVRLEGEAARLVVVLQGEKAKGDVDILVEGFDQAYFRAPKVLSEEGPHAAFGLAIDGLKEPSALRGRTITLTVLAPAARLVRQVTVE